ncbi:hypothetical protein L3Y34_017920 [Caenorhabditis briggsae]|uniref:Uncharacterized protein n=1 Tax=Caenorhabditis briggsae TaxID=6238 RepID=A0AAE9DIU4_CAEBR|nr:hypothetical protein L3Y34_017920 [Caenorhabditis briggsae]
MGDKWGAPTEYTGTSGSSMTQNFVLSFFCNDLFFFFDNPYSFYIVPKAFTKENGNKTEKDNDGEKPNRKTPEKDQQILKRKIENRAQQKTGRGCC